MLSQQVQLLERQRAHALVRVPKACDALLRAQGSRMRNTKTEYVSCPSCGRTLFDLQEITEQIRTRTGHLPGVSIAVMGCIVNGPGEMADADFGCARSSGCCALACWLVIQ